MSHRVSRLAIPALCVLLAAGLYAERERIAPLLPARLAALLGGEASPGAADGTGAERDKGAGKGHGARAPVAVTTAEAKAGSLPLAFQTLGYVRPVASTAMSSEITGRIDTVPLADGATVRKGDLLAALDDRAAAALVAKDEAALQRDQATLDNAEATLARIGKLVTGGAATAQAGDDAATTLKQANATLTVDRAALEADRIALSKTRILAPFDGRIGIVGVSPGALVQPGTTIVTVTQTAPVYAEVSLPESALPTLSRAFSEGTLTAAVTAAGAEGATDEGAVVFLDNAVDQASATIRLRALLPNRQLALVPGQSIDVTVTAGRRDGLVLVPEVAIEPRDDGPVVYVVGADDKVALRKVEIALRAEGEAGLSGGLRAGERVVVEGRTDLAEGTRVAEAAAPVETASEPAAGNSRP